MAKQFRFADFLLDLFDQPCLIIAEDGSRIESNYRDYGDHLYEQGLAEITTLAKELSNASTEVSGTGNKTTKKQKVDFLKDSTFGEAAKAIYCLEGDRQCDPVGGRIRLHPSYPRSRNRFGLLHRLG